MYADVQSFVVMLILFVLLILALVFLSFPGGKGPWNRRH